MLRTSQNIIKRPIILTEKSTRLREGSNQVIFEVVPTANKIEIKNAIQTLFNVTVTDVNTLVMRGKDRRILNDALGEGFYQFLYDACVNIPTVTKGAV